MATPVVTRAVHRLAVASVLAAWPVASLADTGAATTTGGASDDDAFHEPTMGPPLYEGPADNEPPVVIELDDDGFCRVGSTGSTSTPMSTAWGLLLLLAAARQFRARRR
ncbi:MAG: MYXO-CTERM sorting domain-containing protein [Myxococcota bacterium]